MTNPRWIVVGTSFSEGVDHVLAYAIGLATQSRSRVALVHAHEDSLDPSIDVALGLQSRLERAIERSPAARRGVYVVPVLRHGAAWDKLGEVATELGADRIVIGAGTRNAPLSAGSLMTRVIAAAKRLVTVIAVHHRHATKDGPSSRNWNKTSSSEELIARVQATSDAFG